MAKWQIGPENKWRVADEPQRWKVAESAGLACCGCCVCPDFTPHSFTATFLNVNLSSCTTSNAGSRSMGASVGTFSGTFLLTQAPGFLAWSFSQTNYTAHQLMAYGNSNCTLTPFLVTDFLQIQYACIDGIWQTLIDLTILGGGLNGGGARIFYRKGGANCSGGNQANGIAAYVVDDFFPPFPSSSFMGLGGSVILTPNP